MRERQPVTIGSALVTEQLTLDLDNLTSLIDSGERQQLRLVLNEQHPADLAEWLEELDVQRRVSCFRLLDLDNASAVLAELDAEHQRKLLGELGDVGIVPIISKMSPDDAADLLSELPDEKARSIISQMTDDEAVEDIEELMSFKDDSAGGIMSTDYLALNSKMTVEDALSQLREAYEEVEDEIYDLFVVDESDRLVGSLSVKELLTAAPDALVESLMDTSVIKVATDCDQEEAAEKIRRYDLLSLPVVDADGTLRGIITADDAFDVLEEEATEDIYQTSGIDTTGPEATSEVLTSSVRRAFRARIVWLMATVAIESGAAMIINHFDRIIQQTVIAASFMPLLSSVTGSVAMQSTCIVIRGAKKQFNVKSTLKNVWHEIRVGMLLGLACGLATYGISHLFQHANPNLGLVIGISLFLTMTLGVLLGTLIPIIFERLGIEPAHASGPLITSLLDVFTFAVYLSIVHLFLSSIT